MRKTLRRFTGDFLNALEERGETAITVSAIENYAREKLVGSVVDDLKTQLTTTHYGIYVVSALILLAPLIIIFIVKQWLFTAPS